MLNLFYGLEHDITLQAAVLAFGCATFFGVILCSQCPNCGWLKRPDTSFRECSGSSSSNCRSVIGTGVALFTLGFFGLVGCKR